MGRLWNTVVVAAALWAIGKYLFSKDSGDSEEEREDEFALPSTQRWESPEERAFRLGRSIQTPNQYQRLESPLGLRSQSLNHQYAAVPQPEQLRTHNRSELLRGSRQQPITRQRDDLSLSAEELRERATEAHKRKTEAFAESKMMRRAGMVTEAQRLAEEGEEHQRTMERYNKAASEMIFRANNKSRPPNEVDLHRLFVKEAEAKVKEAILVAEERRYQSVQFIVGQGLHSTGGARLKPELKTYIREQLGYPVEESRNAGVLVVKMHRLLGDRAGNDDEFQLFGL